jgi:hypothetical protein
MRGRPFSRIPANISGAAILLPLLLAALGAIGFWMLFSNFALYDDEGYILMSARQYFEQGRLYDVVYSQYGPAYYVFLDFFQHLLRGPVDHTSARFLTLALWLGTAASCGAMVWRQAKSPALALFTLAATFLYLYFLPDEPFHPGSLIIFLLAGSTFVLTELVAAAKWKASAVVAGAVGSILVLTKINVGLFFIAAVCGWSAFNAAPDRLRSLAPVAVTAVFLALAVALMHTLIGETWIHVYLVVFASGAAALALTFDGNPVLKREHAGWFIMAAGAVGLGILASVWLRGTSVAGLLDGVLLRPLRHPGSYSYPVDWRPGTLLWAAVSLALALVHRWLRRKGSSAAADRLVILLRLTQVAALLVGLVLLMHFRVIGAVFSYVAPLIWISVAPLSLIDQTRNQRNARGLLAMVLLLQFLHAFPVGGSQESWGTFLFMPLVALGLGDIRQAWAAQGGIRLARAWSGLATSLAALLVIKAGWTAFETHRKYTSLSALGLPGAGMIRLPENMGNAYRLLTLNAAVHADVVFSLPGMYSFNVWSGLPGPTGSNTTLWFTLLTNEEQGAIIRALEATPRHCIIVQELLLELMQHGGIQAQGPLRDYIYGNYSLAFRLEKFAFLVRRGRKIAPVGVARSDLTVAADFGSEGFNTRIEFCIVGDGAPVVAIEAVLASQPDQPMWRLDAATARVMAAPIDTAGRVLAPPALVSWPLRLHGLARVWLEFSRADGVPPSPATVFYLKGSRGEVHAEARMGD